jgi:2Fe-2S ferredoxin
LDKAFDVKMTSRLGCQRSSRDGLVAVRISKESLEAYYNEHPAETRPGK